MALTTEEVQHLRAALRGTFVQPALDVTVATLQAQLESLGLRPASEAGMVYDRMPDSLALRWGRVYRDPATQCKLIAYASPWVGATGEVEGLASLSVWFCLLPAGYAGKPMDVLVQGLGCEKVLGAEPGAKLLTDNLDAEEWSERARCALVLPFDQALAGISPRCQVAVDTLAEALQP